MKIIRQCDIDDVDVLAIDCNPPVGAGLIPTPPGGALSERRLVAAAEQGAAQTEREVVEVRRLNVGVRVRLPHEPLTEQSYAEFWQAIAHRENPTHDPGNA